MTSIIVTTPKALMAEAAEEAEYAKSLGARPDNRYYRTYRYAPSRLAVGDRVYYVEDGFVRGFCIVDEIKHHSEEGISDGAGAWLSLADPYDEVLMRADSWKWIKPIRMAGFQGYRYAHFEYTRILGGWLDPRPVMCRACDGHGTILGLCRVCGGVGYVIPEKSEVIA